MYLVDRYLKQTKVTDPGHMVKEYEGLPTDIAGLVKVVQNIFLHIHWAERYGATPTEQQKEHVQARLVSRILEMLKEMESSPLTAPRAFSRRFYGNCRDHSVLLVSILRHQGVPARARCGFGTYFSPGHFEDHWIVEYWDGRRWVSVDAQLDDFQKSRLKVDFDTLDMPEGKFVNASDGWLRCRAGLEDPDNFGIFDMRGILFIAGNLLREMAALNDAEMLPWDMWGMMLPDSPDGAKGSGDSGVVAEGAVGDLAELPDDLVGSLPEGGAEDVGGHMAECVVEPAVEDGQLKIAADGESGAAGETEGAVGHATEPVTEPTAGDEANQEPFLSKEQYELLDKVARALAAGDEAEIVRLYNEEPGLRVPGELLVPGA